MPVKVIAEIGGHSDVRLTQNVYQYVYQEAKRDAANKMDELLTHMGIIPPESPVATSATPRGPN